MNKLIFLLVLMCLLSALSGEDKYEEQRNRMVSKQIKARGITDAATLAAMRKVPRHKFVPALLHVSAYSDRPLPIGSGQTISQPYIVAYMTEIIAPKKEDKVLEIGTGSGYQAAVLAEIADSVYTIEIIPKLAQRAQEVLAELNYSNVVVKNADGYYGWEKFAPFDAIVVTAAAEHIPPPLIEQLKEGGKMIIPVGSPFMTQQLILLTKKNGEITTQTLFPVRFVPLTREND
jgi:protein-L-isoaspartate(D-aspartate) O-methyltransferase